jgi:hypothetical protein
VTKTTAGLCFKRRKNVRTACRKYFQIVSSNGVPA